MNISTNLFAIIATGALSMLVGCEKDQPTDVVQTVDWYKAHEKERVEMLAICQNNPGQLASTPNCMNAQQAQGNITWGAKGGSIKIEPLTFK